MVNALAMPSVSKSFADVIAHFKTRVSAAQDIDSLDVILEPDVGLANKLHEICAHEYDEAVARRNDKGATDGEREEWRLERDTWDLIGRLYTERSLPDETALTLPTPSQMVQRNPYTPTSALAQRAISQHTILRELYLVREWLHDTAPATPRSIAGMGTNYRALTKHRVVHARRGAGAQAFVTALDPDAEHRKGGGGALDADDATAEKALSRALLALMRAGKYEDARALCRMAGHDWRAAMIGGVTSFKWDAV
ncbi:Nucleoporin nup84, partial [Ceratobasidium sp. 392]